MTPTSFFNAGKFLKGCANGFGNKVGLRILDFLIFLVREDIIHCFHQCAVTAPPIKCSVPLGILGGADIDSLRSSLNDSPNISPFLQ